MYNTRKKMYLIRITRIQHQKANVLHISHLNITLLLQVYVKVKNMRINKNK